jgi:hypothetical protein
MHQRGRSGRRMRIDDCGDFCGDLSYILAHLATSQINLQQLLNCLNLRGLQSFCLPFNNLAKSVKMVSGTRGRRFKVPRVLINAVTSKVGSSIHLSANPTTELLRPLLLRRQRPDTIDIQLSFGTPACHPFWNCRSEFLIETECVPR